MKKVQDKELDVTTDNSNGSSALNASSREDSKQRIINLEKNYQNKLNDELEKRDSVHKIEIQREHQIIELQHKEQIKLLNDQIETQRMDIELKDKENKRLQQEHHEKNQTLRTTESELQLQITS